jgi:uroporphyrinogen decarboxylase
MSKLNATQSGLSYRERFARTLNHAEVDRPPMDLGATDMTGIYGGPRRLAPLLGLGPLPEAEADEAVLQALDIDIRDVGGVLEPTYPPARRPSATEFVNVWGIRHAWQGDHYEQVGHPLAGATTEDLDRYPWPDPERIPADQIAAIRERARYLHAETPCVVCARHPVFGVFELGCWLCGFDDFLYRVAAEPDFVRRFFDIVLRYQLRVIDLYYGAIGGYIDYTTSGDDFGTQRAPMLSPAMFRALVLPYLAARIRATRRHTAAAFFHHSCGAIRPLIPDLIAAGVQILNPIQPRAAGMEPAALKRDFGGLLVFYGGVDTQELLPRGTPEEVFEATRSLIGTLGQSGGYILSAAHTCEADVPPENIVAMYKAGLAARPS